MWINSTNPNITSFLEDPWCYEIPLALKSTFLNISFDICSLHVSDFVANSNWDMNKPGNMFGDNLNSSILNLGQADPIERNNWVYYSESNNNRIVSAIYSFLNCRKTINHGWKGWAKIWKLKVAPKVQFFTSLTMHGRIKTFQFLHAISLGSAEMCVFCGLCYENIEHNFSTCCKTQSLGEDGCRLSKNIFLSYRFCLRLLVGRYIFFFKL